MGIADKGVFNLTTSINKDTNLATNLGRNIT
jgi:hypothetical protein